MRSETDGIDCAPNDKVWLGPCWNRTQFPAGTTARIFRRGRSAMTSGMAGTRCWRMTFRGPGRRFTEPVMGWTGSTDPLIGLEIKFPTLEAAIRYARRQGLDFAVDGTLAPATLPLWPLHERGAPAVDQKHAA
jgi:NADH dehydrogenase ubiquinone Fe-S protein 4